MILLLSPLIAISCGMVIPFFSNRHIRNLFVMGMTILISVILCLLCLNDSGTEIVFFSVTPLFTLGFCLDGISRVFLMLISFLWPLSVLYAFEYMEDDPHQSRFFAFYTLSYGVTQLLAMSRNLFTLYLFYECLTLVTLPLVTHYENEDSFRAGMTYLKYTVGGAALGLIAVVLQAFTGTSGAFLPGGAAERSVLFSLSPVLIHLSVLLSFIGFGTKAAIVPLSAWLPRASVAPTPVTALLHAVAVVNAGVFACIRLLYDCFGSFVISGTWVQTGMLLLCSFTILFGAVMAVRERHLKRRLAWSTVYNLSYMLFSAALLTPAGLQGALTHLVFHGLMKITLFFCAGAFLIKARAEYLPELRGLFHRMPVTVTVFTVAGVALTGIPPLVGFLSKWSIVTAAVSLGSWAAWVGAGAVVLSSVLACIYLLEPAVLMFFSPSEVFEKAEKNRHPLPVRADTSSVPSLMPGKASSDPSWRILFPLILLTICIVILGIWPAPVRALLVSAVAPY